MRSHVGSVFAVALCAFGLAAGAGAQTVEFDNNFKFNSGQDVQPIFEGWSHNPDGSFSMHFGFLNRNWVEHLVVPVGPHNAIEPGGPDRGQPTYFPPRMQRNIFTVVVPKDWGKKELVWTLTANGRTQRAFGWLQADWEIDPIGGATGGGQVSEELKGNTPPAITIAAPASAAVGQALTLSVAYSDDGIPKPGPPRRRVTTGNAPALTSPIETPVNLPDLAPARPQSGGGGGATAPTAPYVTWAVYRGPANVDFAARTVTVKDGKAETTASFAVTGEYVLRARASDRHLFIDKDVTIIVTGSR
jgi:hypothetical protein